MTLESENYRVSERVARGAAWLDRVYVGWERDIDTGILDVSTCSRCILGQLDGRWSALDVGLTDVETDEFGFFAITETAYGLKEAAGEYRALDEAWTILIKERFNAGTLSDDGSV